MDHAVQIDVCQHRFIAAVLATILAVGRFGRVPMRWVVAFALSAVRAIRFVYHLIFVRKMARSLQSVQR